MRQILYITFALILSCALLFSCQDMLDTDSGRVAFEGGEIDNPDDAFYTMTGILTEIQKLGDRMVIFGELRGDLMTAPEGSTVSLKEINDFSVTSENTYLDKRDFYNVINNCNYAIQKMDTGVIRRNEKVMLPYYATIKTIRAWTYFQLVQTFGKVAYLEEPVLNLEASLAEYPELGIDALVDELINDLAPYALITHPSDNYFLKTSVMLADLYLYRNDYEQAANMYYTVINNGDESGPYLINGFVTRWANGNFDGYGMGHPATYRYPGSGGGETLAAIEYSGDAKDFHSDLVKLTYHNNPSLLPSQNFIDSMSIAPYVYATSLGGVIASYTEGDLRGRVVIEKYGEEEGDAYMTVDINKNQSPVTLICKFYFNSAGTSAGSDPTNELIQGQLDYLTYIPLSSIPQLYLRFAEAVNRTGKPSLAYAVIKYGLNDANINNPSVVNPSEIAKGEAYLNFEKIDYNSNISIAARGKGLGVPRDTRYFVIPDFTRTEIGYDEEGNQIDIPTTDPTKLQAALQDSIEWVELRILEEMAAERPFEGNRFIDLMRISRRRENHPEFMAEKVAAKYSNPEVMKAKLMNPDAWFLPEK